MDFATIKKLNTFQYKNTVNGTTGQISGMYLDLLVKNLKKHGVVYLDPVSYELIVLPESDEKWCQRYLASDFIQL